MTVSRWLWAKRPSSVRLRLLVVDRIRKGIVRPAGVDEVVGSPHASSENHSNSTEAAETKFGIIFDEWISSNSSVE